MSTKKRDRQAISTIVVRVLNRKAIMKLPRLFHRLYAFFSGYFWLPCPICGKMFGGHEAYFGLMTNLSGGSAVCKACELEAKRLNRLLFEEMSTEKSVD